MSILSSSDKNRKKDSFIVKAVRILAAVALLILVNTLKMSDFISVILSIAAALIAGFDVLLSAFAAIGRKAFFSSSVVIVFAAIVGFAVSCTKEACLLIIMYQLGNMLLDYALLRSKKEMLQLVSEESGYFTISEISDIVSKPTALSSSLLSKVAPFAEILLKAATVVGILYAVLLPLISDMTYIMSVRRGLMLILAAAPAAALVSLPLCAETGIAYSTVYGSIIKDAETLEKMSTVSTAVFDKDGVFSDGSPKLSSISSPILDSGTFKALAAYVAYNSQLRIAAPIVEAYKGTVNPQYIDSFNDIPGSGMEISIHGVQICIMTKDVFDLRGIDIPESEMRDGLTFYMSVDGKYAGRLTFKENVNPYAKDLVNELNNCCGIETVLISEDAEDATADFAAAIGVKQYRYAVSAEEKASVIREIKDEIGAGECLIYASGESGKLHSSADIDIRTADDEVGDITMAVGMSGVPAIHAISKSIIKRQKINLIAMFALKLILIVLAMTGAATMWFIVFADPVLAALAVLNASRDPRFVVGE